MHISSNALNVIEAFTVTADSAAATDTNVLAMSAVVYTPAIMRTLKKVSLSSGTMEIVKPNPSCSTISVCQGATDVSAAKTISEDEL